MALSISDSDVKVYNAALALLGVRPVGSLLEQSIAGRTGNTLYLDTLEDALSYPWRFAVKTLPVQKLEEAPQTDWDAYYAIPNEMIALRTVWAGDRRVAFDVFEQKIALRGIEVGTEQVRAEGSCIVGPTGWPGYFRAAFITHLAAVVAMPITQDERLASFWAQQAETKMLRAKSIDAQGRTPQRLDTRAFIRARRRVGGRI